MLLSLPFATFLGHLSPRNVCGSILAVPVYANLAGPLGSPMGDTQHQPWECESSVKKKEPFEYSKLNMAWALEGCLQHPFSKCITTL